MKIIVWGKGERGKTCLEALLNTSHQVKAVVLQKASNDAFAEYAKDRGMNVLLPGNPNDHSFLESLSRYKADVFVLAGYGKILKKETIELPEIMAINLHAGELPKRRGSSPLNWALIEGDSHFGLSIIKVDSGVDTGPILLQRKFPIEGDFTISDLHAIANREFPQMIVAVLNKLAAGSLEEVKQNRISGAYYPVRFPEDGVIFFDQMNAEDIHNRIRALTDPYPCAYGFYAGKKVLFKKSRLTKVPFYGEPGRIYQIREGELLVCASDMCLWIVDAVFEDEPDEVVATFVNRYSSFATLRGVALDRLMNQ